MEGGELNGLQISIDVECGKPMPSNNIISKDLCKTIWFGFSSMKKQIFGKFNKNLKRNRCFSWL